MRRLRPLLVALTALAGCDSGFAIDVDLERDCAPHLDVKVQIEPSGQTSEIQDVQPDIHRITIIPPSDATSVIVSATARDDFGPFAVVSTSVRVDGHRQTSAFLDIKSYCNGDMPIRDGGTTPDDATTGCSPGQCGNQICDTQSGRCVDCLKNGDCPLATVCSGQHTCVPGCTGAHGCGDGGTCDVDAGQCDVCKGDQDCGGGFPRCDLSTGQCVRCLPTGNDCPMGQQCERVNGSYQCASQCSTDQDCASLGNTYKCCNKLCTDVTSDRDNCGGCGTVCMLPHATAGCFGSMCTIAQCDANYGDCDFNPTTGCEADITSDPNNCGGCMMPCSGYNVMGSTCSGKTCVGTCVPGAGDCDNDLRSDGCETDLNSDPNNCGACGKSCPSLSCTNRMCDVFDMSMPDSSTDDAFVSPDDLAMPGDFATPYDLATPYDAPFFYDLNGGGADLACGGGNACTPGGLCSPFSTPLGSGTAVLCTIASGPGGTFYVGATGSVTYHPGLICNCLGGTLLTIYKPSGGLLPCGLSNGMCGGAVAGGMPSSCSGDQCGAVCSGPLLIACTAM